MRIRSRWGVPIASAALIAASLVAAPTSVAAARSAGDAWLPTTPANWPLVVDESGTKPLTLTHGVEHWSDHLNTVGGAQRAQVLNVDLADPNVRLGVVESHDHLTDPVDEVPSSMAHRTGAVAGVNSDFFAIYGSGRAEGVVVIDGQLDKSPDPTRPWDLWVRDDGSIGIGQTSYTGTIAADDGSTEPITSVNVVEDLSKSGGALVHVTPFLGTPSPIPAATVVSGTVSGDQLTVADIKTGVTDLPQLPEGTTDLVATGAQAAWLTAHVKVGDTVTTAESLSPDQHIRQAVSGGAILVKDGALGVPLQGGGENNVDNPVTAVGVTKDGTHAVFAAFDGHQPEGVAQGLTRPQIAGWMMQHGAYNAILFDSGGSTQMVGRLPGQTEASVLNVPSDGHERPVANGLFIYSTETAPTTATSAVVNAGKPLSVLVGTTIDVPAYALDRAGNPAAEPVSLSVFPPSLASVHGTSLSAGTRGGVGILRIKAGRAQSLVPLKVVTSLPSLSVSPAQVDLNNGVAQQLTLSAGDVTLSDEAVHWTVDPADLGSVDAHGIFTAAASGNGLATVTASVGGTSASVSVAIGQTTVPVDSLHDISKWSVTDQYVNVYPRKVPSPGPDTGPTGSISASDESPPGSSSGSMAVHYHYPNQSKTFDLSIYLDDPESEQIGLRNGNQAPIGIGVWVKGNADLATRPGKALDPGIVSLNIGIWQASNQPTSFYPTGVTWDGWQYVVANLPAGLQFPLRVNYLGLVTIKPGPNLTGDVLLSGLQAVYSPRPPVPPVYHALPDNPSWLKFTDVGSFSAGGTTLAAMDDAHVRAADPGGTGPTVMKSIGTSFGTLPAASRPTQVQALGDMPDSGDPANLDLARSLLDGLGVPYRDAVGNHEITQGATPETGNYAAVFGDTHYQYAMGSANVIVTDSAHIGILASDPYQNVDADESQYQWLVDQLSANTSPVTVIVTHVPAYDPHPRADSQFADRWEAQMYEELANRYQQTHPFTHVLMLFGHSRGWAEEIRSSAGALTSGSGGVPNFVIADAGSPPYAPTDQGGFYNYGLFHVLPNGTVQFAVQPVLASVTVDRPASSDGPASVAVGSSVMLTAIGTTVTGDDATALTMPITDPVSRAWTSSDPRVASVDRRTGVVTGHHSGTVTITVIAGGVAGTLAVTVN